MSKFYAVARGKIPGIYNTWNETKIQVNGFPRALYKGFKTREEAEKFIMSTSLINSTMLTSLINVILYTDGSCANKYGGCGIVIKYGDESQLEYSRIVQEYPTTNNRAELYAILYGLTYVKKMMEINSNNIKIDLYTDSSYSIDAINYRKANIIHETNNDLVTLITELDKSLTPIEYHHVYGHKTNELNNKADQLACIASSKAQSNICED